MTEGGASNPNPIGRCETITGVYFRCQTPLDGSTAANVILTRIIRFLSAFFLLNDCNGQDSETLIGAEAEKGV